MPDNFKSNELKPHTEGAFNQEVLSGNSLIEVEAQFQHLAHCGKPESFGTIFGDDTTWDVNCVPNYREGEKKYE